MTSRCAQIRNVGIVAHINAGKTTLSERILYDTGAQRFMGEVDDGTAAMDFLTEEQRRGISISAAVTRVEWKGHRIHLIDTPGHVDFTAEVERCLRVLDAVVVLLDGVRGVESQTEVVWRQAERHRIPRLLFVNKLDRPGAEMGRVLAAAAERLGARVVPVGWPLYGEGESGGREFGGIADLARRAAQRFDGREVALPSELSDARGRLLEACADLDDEILADVVEDRPVDAERVVAAVRRGTIANRLVPALPGSALLNRGVDLLLDSIALYLPSPLDLPPILGVEGGECVPDPAADLCALVFKRIRDGGDRRVYVRIYSGTLRPGAVVGVTGRSPGDLLVREIAIVRGGEFEVVERAGPGDVVAITVDRTLRTGDTVHAVERKIALESVNFPEPVLAVRLEPTAEGDLDDLMAAAEELADEDPTLRLTIGGPGADDPTELRAEGMGELHLEVFASRLRRRVGDRVRIGVPRVQRRVSVRGAGRGEAECRSADGRSRARVTLDLAPAVDREAPPAVSVDPEVGRNRELGSALVAAVEEEFGSRLEHGLGPDPARGVVGSVVRIQADGESEAALLLAQEAASVALRKAVAAAGSVVLEPFVDLVVTCPRDCKSHVLSDLRSRAAAVRQVVEDLAAARIEAWLPLAETLGYTTALRSMSRGLGDAELRPAGYAVREA